MSNEKINIFYFSGTGNTWWVSQQITEELTRQGLNAYCYSIEQVSEHEAAQLVQACDVVGLGFPIYGSDVPVNFHTFIQALPGQDPPKPTLGFVTQWAWSGDGMNFLEKELRAKGYDLQWAAEFNMFNNIALTIFPALYSAEYDTFSPKLEINAKKIKKLCEKITQGTHYRQHANLIDAALGWVQRGPFRLIHEWGRKQWSVDAEACNSCERCARICPVNNIRMVDGLPIHGTECVYCMRCYNYCPTYAVQYLGASNKRMEKKPPFQGPISGFRPELITKKHIQSTN